MTNKKQETWETQIGKQESKRERIPNEMKKNTRTTRKTLNAEK